MKRQIYTYFAEVPEIRTIDERKLLAEWMRGWGSESYTTVVLTEAMAQKHPRFETLKTWAEAMNTINPRAYETACIYRWAALSAVGGGLMSDYDVLPIRPIELNESELSNLTIMQGEIPESACPSFLYGKPAELDAFIEFLISRPSGHHAEVINGKPHYSDQHAIREFIKETGGATMIRKVWNYNEPGLVENAICTHFNRSSMHPSGFSPRWKYVRQFVDKLRDEIKAKRKI